MFDNTRWTIGRIGGITVSIDPSWVVIAFLIAYTFYIQLSVRFEDAAAAVTIPTAVVMAALFFGSVLLHELAHSWVAVGRGVEVRGITLFLFGGATQADLETEEPTDELVISIVGPITSLVLAGILWLLSVALPGDVASFATGWLGWINLALAVFNMLPGLPLDGGRVVRSLVWRNTGDPVRATRLAARGGQLLGYGLIGLGILEIVFLGALIGGLWLMAIGWFLSRAAQASYLHLQIRRILSDVPASRIMSTDMVEIPPHISLEEAVDDYFLRHDVNAFPVRDGRELTGLATLSAVRQIPREEWSETRISEVAEPMGETCTVTATEPLDQVVDKLMGGELRRVLVVDETGDAVGIITPRDLTHWLQRSADLGLIEQ